MAKRRRGQAKLKPSAKRPNDNRVLQRKELLDESQVALAKAEEALTTALHFPEPLAAQEGSSAPDE